MDLGLEQLVTAVILLPLIGSALWFWVGRKWGEIPVTIGAVLVMVLSFLSVLTLFLQIDVPVRVELLPWLQLHNVSIASFSFLLDPLSLMLGMIVTGVGSLIHLYASGYMKGDEGFGRFFSYLNLFVFSMMMLIWSESLVGIFLGWEGVGVCSYLLISFWFSEDANATAGKKAFIVNRVGDLGFLVAMFSLYKVFGTLSIPEFLSQIALGGLSPDQMFWTQLAAGGFIVGAAGKSAQIPLYVWLPDAMAGPTPVSALIHAATMVTAGVYLTCRLQPLFLLHPDMLNVVAWVGGLTAFFAATIAVFQYDIKKVLAYSTVSQLGYMFLAVGLAAPVAAYFHLITHAFFKALLFLGAGSVIVGLHHEQDMRKMGGIRKQMPITFWTVTIGVLAIAGIAPLSGFFSKDEIIHVAMTSHKPGLMILALLTALMTAFYMGRFWIMTFFGKFRGHHEAHETPWQMTSVLIVLAVLSVLGGLLNVPEAWGGNAWLHHYFSSVVQQESHGEGPIPGVWLVVFVSTLSIFGLAYAYRRYKDYDGKEDFDSQWFTLFKHKYYIDEIYDEVFVQNLKRIGNFLWKVVDQKVLDGTLNGLASGSEKLGDRLRSVQTGWIQSYALWIWLGLIVFLISAWTVRL